MGIKRKSLYPPLLFFFSFCLCYNHHVHLSDALDPAPNTTGYSCPANQSTYPCQAYAFYRATSPDFLDLASIGDLFSVSRLMISKPSNISSPASPLIPNQSLFVPLSCSCNSVSSSTIISYAGLNYTIKKGDTFWLVSTRSFQNLTTYQSVEVVNPTLVPTNLSIGDNVVFPVFCKCPNTTQLQNQTKFFISYVRQPFDNYSSIASRFGSTAKAIADVNGENVQPFETVFVPVSGLPQLAQPNVNVSSQPNVTVSSPGKNDQKGTVIGLAIGLGICGVLLFLVGGLWGYRESVLKKRKGMEGVEEGKQLSKGRKGQENEVNLSLVADVSDCLDKYRMFGIEELREATDEFDERWLIQGSVYKGCIDGELYAIKKMKWNAREELKILQKVISKLLHLNFPMVVLNFHLVLVC